MNQIQVSLARTVSCSSKPSLSPFWKFLCSLSWLMSIHLINVCLLLSNWIEYSSLITLTNLWSSSIQNNKKMCRSLGQLWICIVLVLRVSTRYHITEKKIEGVPPYLLDYFRFRKNVYRSGIKQLRISIFRYNTI